MILEYPPTGDRTYDVCIVGSGPIGMALALELERLGRDVLVLESGNSKIDPSAAEASRAELADLQRHAIESFERSQSFEAERDALKVERESARAELAALKVERDSARAEIALLKAELAPAPQMCMHKNTAGRDECRHLRRKLRQERCVVAAIRPKQSRLRFSRVFC